MKVLQAKLRVSRVEQHKNRTEQLCSETVHLNAVYSDDPTSENYSFSQATPCADLTMQINNPSALGFFQEGQEFVLEFTAADAAPADDAPAASAPTE